ncbi:MAG: ABC transporter substrate-binding protein, partial [Ferruginibacter sp.]|nr:ABC transporter substrate-binding protein [Ferruginibacter sp.]
MKDAYSYTLIIVLFSIVNTGCKSHQHPDKMIFRYNEVSGIASLDPAFAKNQSVMWPVHQLYNTLVEVDKHLQVKPSLAKRWEYAD